MTPTFKTRFLSVGKVIVCIFQSFYDDRWMNNMIQLKDKLILYFVFVFLLSLLSCADMAPSVAKNAEAEIWQLEFSGQTRGNLEMTLNRIEIIKDAYSVSGKIVGEIEDHLGGSGIADFTLEGSIKDGVLKSSLNGHAAVAEGLSPTNGTLQGDLSDVEGSGTWTIMHTLGSSSGNYTMKRAKNLEK